MTRLTLRCLMAVAGATLFVACKSNEPTSNATGFEATSAPPVGTPGSHVSVHGMTLFGSGNRFYLSHIPLFEAPHDVQTVVEVAITAGVPPAEQKFNTQNFTVRPNQFSLSDFANGNVARITGTIFQGNFESGGRPVFRDVNFDVKQVLFRRALSTSTPRNPNLDYIAVGSPSDAYLVHVIDAPPSFDHVVAVQLGQGSFLDQARLDAGTIVRIGGGVNDVGSRLRRGAPVTASLADSAAASAEGTSAARSITVTAELGCLPGADFFGACAQ